MLVLRRRQKLAEIRELIVVTQLCEDHEQQLHYHHPTRRHLPLPQHLHKLHSRAKDASHLAIDVAHNWPEDQKALLHRKAAEIHAGVSKHFHHMGFHGLGNQHDTWAQHHAATAAQHDKAHKARLVRGAPEGGHSRSGHTLPTQPHPAQHTGDVPTASKGKPKKGHSWNPQSGGNDRVPRGASKAAERASDASHEASHLHHNKSVHPAEKLKAHQAAFKAHVKAANEYRRHGFQRHADEHDRHAQTHLTAQAHFRRAR